MKNELTIRAKEILREHGIQPSIQRVKVLEFLLKNRTHPSADEMYKALSAELPTLSKTTIYNTIESFKNKGIIKIINIDPNEIRVDAYTEPHAHFHCVKCGKVYDVDWNFQDLSGKRTKEGHLIEFQEVYLQGICKNCLES